jgi:D-sedoheptulose 7-phosphate isomerase
MRKRIIEKLEKHNSIINQIIKDEALIEIVKDVAFVVIDCYKRGGKVILFGCGGSAADSQHIAAEFINTLNFDRDSLPALALTTDTSVLTAIGNDYTFNRIFSRQITALACDGDVVIGISTSGKSESVLEGLKEAKRKNASTVLLTGIGGGRDTADYVVCVPSDKTTLIQEAHIALAHIICYLVEEELFCETA